MNYEMGVDLLNRGLAVSGENKDLVAARVKFWTHESAWPENLPGFIFLARAVQEVGRKLFPKSWSGEEGRAFLPTLLPDYVRPHHNDKLRAYRILHGGADRSVPTQRFRHPFPPSPFQIPMPEIPITDSEYGQVSDMLASLYEMNQPAALRFDAATAALASACDQGKLAAYRVTPGNNTMTPISPTAWLQLHKVVFIQCEAGPLSKPKATGHGWTPVYIQAESLSVFCASPPAAKADTHQFEVTAPASESCLPRELKRATAGKYRAYAEAYRAQHGSYPKREDDRTWARAENYSVHSVFRARAEFGDSLPDTPEKRAWLKNRPKKQLRTA